MSSESATVTHLSELLIIGNYLKALYRIPLYNYYLRTPIAMGQQLSDGRPPLQGELWHEEVRQDENQEDHGAQEVTAISERQQPTTPPHTQHEFQHSPPSEVHPSTPRRSRPSPSDSPLTPVADCSPSPPDSLSTPLGQRLISQQIY
ncbi:MAG: hypothetical protein MMC33_010886 [Icmadophila ericetorum]|nr:hypothetical protein [Icmadophila ericetorum]